MSPKTKFSQPSIASLLLLSLALTGAICLWCDREVSSHSPAQIKAIVLSGN